MIGWCRIGDLVATMETLSSGVHRRLGVHRKAHSSVVDGRWEKQMIHHAAQHTACGSSGFILRMVGEFV